MNIETVDYQAPDAKHSLTRSLHNTGFAVLANHPVTPERIASIYENWGNFFASDDKHDWLRDPENQDGYFPFRSENAKGQTQKDLKEFYHVYSWGRVPPSLEAETRAMHKDLTDLGIELLSWLQAETPEDVKRHFTMPLEAMMGESVMSLLRILHYPPLAQSVEDGAIRAAAHEDINLITLLLAGSQPGLQAQDKQGNWHEISCDTGMITINNGDMLSLASQDYFPSTTHRVVNPDASDNQSRYSMPIFLHPRSDVMLDKDLSAGAFLQQRLKEIGLK
ncbi:MAG: isopenicillin N synthase family dioxygenase [Candidatus Puniceispirillaceae bacterium]